MNALNAQAISIIRTITPVLVGQLMTWLAAKGILDETGEISAAMISLLTVVSTTLYYTLARYLETFVSERFGWLLGYAQKPVYKEVK